MFPTSTLPVSPFMGGASLGLVVGVLAVGGIVAMAIGYAVHRRAERRAPQLDVDEPAESARRLSA